MNDTSLDDLARRLEELPREAWDRPVAPPAPWPAEERQRAVRSRRLMLRPIAALAGSAVLVAAGVLGGLALSGGDDSAGGLEGTPQKVQLAPIDSRAESGGGVAEVSSGAGGNATVELTGLKPSSSRDFYELWLLGEGGELVSLGSFRVPESGKAQLDVPVPVDPAQFRYLDVSREPADGDPSHSTVSILRGPTA